MIPGAVAVFLLVVEAWDSGLSRHRVTASAAPVSEFHWEIENSLIFQIKEAQVEEMSVSLAFRCRVLFHRQLKHPHSTKATAPLQKRLKCNYSSLQCALHNHNSQNYTKVYLKKQFKMLVITFLSETFGGSLTQTDQESVQQILQWD